MQTTQVGNSNRYKWHRVLQIPNGHRYFRSLVGKCERFAVADDSGETPHLTDDGVLWLDLDRDVIVDDDGGWIPVIVAHDGSRSRVHETADDAITVAIKFGFGVRVADRYARFVQLLLQAMSGGARVQVKS